MTTDDLQKRGDKNLSHKLMLEGKFIPKIEYYFDKIIYDFETLYLATGEIISKKAYLDSTEALLKNHYRDVIKIFSREFRENSDIESKRTANENRDRDALVMAALIAIINREIPIRSSDIDSTNEENIFNSVTDAYTEARDNGEDPTKLFIATTSASLIKTKMASRVQSIAITENSWMAETSKFVEAIVVTSDIPPLIDDIMRMTSGTSNGINTGKKKRWVSVIDAKTRRGQFDHVKPNGQIVDSSSPFIVSGEQLMFPCDRSFGSSAGNIINCRCSSLYLG